MSGAGSLLQLAGGLMAVVRVRLQRTRDDCGQSRRHLGGQREQVARVVEATPGQQLPEHDPQRVQIRALICRVAEGRADIYARMSPIMEWDTAAGDCIYRYSGAAAERPSPLRYNSRELRFPQFVIGVDVGHFDQKVVS